MQHNFMLDVFFSENLLDIALYTLMVVTQCLYRYNEAERYVSVIQKLRQDWSVYP